MTRWHSLENWVGAQVWTRWSTAWGAQTVIANSKGVRSLLKLPNSKWLTLLRRWWKSMVKSKITEQMAKQSVLRKQRHGFVKLCATSFAWWVFMEGPPETSAGTSLFSMFKSKCWKMMWMRKFNAFWADNADLVSKKVCWIQRMERKEELKCLWRWKSYFQRTLKR